MIGNGFDISLGIKSSYSDFYKWYCKTESSSPHIKAFKESIASEIASEISPEERVWSDFELGLGKYTSNFTPSTVEDFLDCLDNATQNIRLYLEAQEKDFQLSNYTEESQKKLANSLVGFYSEVSAMEKTAIKQALAYYANNQCELSFISFNYTKCLDEIISSIPDSLLSTNEHKTTQLRYKIKRTVIHVHGTTNEYPILGINDETQIVNKALLGTPQFSDFMIKANNVQALGMYWHNQAIDEINSSAFICVLGMSLGESDARWWRQLISWLRNNSRGHIILYWYVNDPPSRTSAIRRLQKIEYVKNKFLSFADLSDEANKHLKNRIHVIINTKQFMALEKSEEHKNLMCGSEHVESLGTKFEELGKAYEKAYSEAFASHT